MEAKLGGSSGVNGHWGHCEGTGAKGQLGGQKIGAIKEKPNDLAVLGKKTFSINRDCFYCQAQIPRDN